MNHPWFIGDSIILEDNIIKTKKDITLSVRFPAEHARSLIEKGSITVDGISLTCFEIGADTFKVALIEHTLNETALHTQKAGDLINLEFDIIGKYVERLMQPHAGTQKSTYKHNRYLKTIQQTPRRK